MVCFVIAPIHALSHGVDQEAMLHYYSALGELQMEANAHLWEFH